MTTRAPSEPAGQVAVVIPTAGRRPALLAETARVLAADPACAGLVVVVDGGDPDALRAAAALPGAIAVPLVPRAGPAAARALGVARAAAPLVLLLDDDVVPAAGIATAHAAAHAGAAGRVVVGPMPVAAVGSAADALYAEAYDRWLAAVTASPAGLLARLWLGNASLPRAVALAVGVDEPAFRGLVGHEDRALGLRLRAAGLVGVVAPGAVARHVVARSVAGLRRDAWQQGASLAILHRAHAAELGPLPADAYLEGLPRPLASALAQLGRAGLDRPLAAMLAALADAAWRLRLRAPSLLAARLVRRLEARRGVAAMRRAGRA